MKYLKIGQEGGDNDAFGFMFTFTERKLKAELPGNETSQGKEENRNMTHREIRARAKHARVRTKPQDNTSSFLRTTSHRASSNLSGGCVSEEGEMKGQEVSMRLRGHSDVQAQTTGALLCSASM